MTYDRWKTRSSDDDVNYHDGEAVGESELDLVYEDLAIVQSQKEELLAALKLVDPIVKWLRDDQYVKWLGDAQHIAEIAKTVHDAIAKAERKS